MLSQIWLCNPERTYDPDGDCVAGLREVVLIILTSHDDSHAKSNNQADAMENPKIK